MTEVSETENKLIELSQTIGGIAECNGHFTAGLARVIDDRGKPVEDYTLRELAELWQEFSDAINEIYDELDKES